jgi:hypothetical protein
MIFRNAETLVVRCSQAEAPVGVAPIASFAEVPNGPRVVLIQAIAIQICPAEHGAIVSVATVTGLLEVYTAA